jgi:hypothetical protein
LFSAYFKTGVIDTVAFALNHFSGKIPFTVTGILFPTVSRGEGVTAKLDCLSGFRLEQETPKKEINNRIASDS